ncbi:MAG: exonuclease subunit SbcD [Candidatus Desulfofervidus auxilii]|nr:exonuclease subunit SbcD [Candidatus Desulfofervidus auxilii]
MLKLLHTADWHLGKTFKNTDFSLLEIQQEILKEIVEITEKEDVDVVLIAGDIFDSYNPPFKAEELFYSTLRELTANGRRLVIAIAGNHDAPEKFDVPKPLAAGFHAMVICGSPQDDLSLFSFKTNHFGLKGERNFLQAIFPSKNASISLLLLPYPSEARLKVSTNYEVHLKNILQAIPPYRADEYIIVSHLFVQGGQKSGSERDFTIGGAQLIPLDFFPKYANYIALGHLHRYQCLGKNIFYSGSIFPFDIQEANQNKGVLLRQPDGKIEFYPFTRQKPVKSLNFNTINEALEQSVNFKNSLVFLRFPAIAASPEEIAKLKQAYSHNLLGFRFEMPKFWVDRPIAVADLTPEELFVEFYKEKYNQTPDEAVVRLFLKFVEELKNETC